MNYIDVALIVIIVVIGFRGFASGFIAELCSLSGVLLGVYLGSVFATPVGNALTNIYNFDSNTIHTTLGFIIVLLVCWTLFVLIGVVLASKLVFLRLDFLNKGLGFIFSSVKVFFIFSFIAYAVSNINFIRENFAQTAKQKSQMYVNMITIASKIMTLPQVQQTAENLNNINQGKPSSDSFEQGIQAVKEGVTRSDQEPTHK